MITIIPQPQINPEGVPDQIHGMAEDVRAVMDAAGNLMEGCADSLGRVARGVGGIVARRLFLSEDDFERAADHIPERRLTLPPADIFKVVKTSTGAIPVYGYNADYMGGKSPDVIMPKPLGVRPGAGLGALLAERVRRTCQEQDRGLWVIGGPGSNGEMLSPAELARLDLRTIVDSSEQALRETAEDNEIDLDRVALVGASMGALISFTMAGESRDNGLDVAGVAAIAPAGWKLSALDRARFFAQFGITEPAHIIDKASKMPHAEFLDYANTYKDTIPSPAAAAAVAKLLFGGFGFGGTLDKVIDDLPRDLLIRAVAFRGDTATKPNKLAEKLNRFEFPNARVEIVAGQHASLDSGPKTKRAVSSVLKETV
jgi:pimeloyl-ACP methyl ester carboxylesterase